jgi:hypothetical protein
MNFPAIGLHVPEILLPGKSVDLHRWAVIACDQYTAQPQYWTNVERIVDGRPSTLSLIFPEVYLESPGRQERIAAIRAAMDAYLRDGVLVSQGPGFVLVDRQTAHTASRKGLVVALDLEHYDFRPDASTLIRATEGTIVERLPPRIEVRAGAPIESPHIMVLIDDPGRTVIERLFDEDLELLYDTELMLNGGRVRGYGVADPVLLGRIAKALANLAGIDQADAQPVSNQDQPLLYAMGDGNHSFATAKAIWEKLKAETGDPQAIMDHPARYTLVELVNLHDPGLEFEAIHRVLFRAGLNPVLAAMAEFFAHNGGRLETQEFESLTAAWQWAEEHASDDRHYIPFVSDGRHGLAMIRSPRLTLEVASLQAFLDEFLKHHPESSLDYIHGEAAVSELSAKPDTVGFFLPALSKLRLFKSIAADGPLPRKTFSMGEADEKRFYLECRRINP